VLNADDSFPSALALERSLDRRRLLRTAGASALLVAAGEWAARRARRAHAAPLEVLLAADQALALGIGEARALRIPDGREALAVRIDASTVVAFDRRCPHLGCPVRFVAERARFECPCHHAAFDARTGGVLFGPPRRGLEAATVRIA
jgi:Rieske Fe-S protein